MKITFEGNTIGEVLDQMQDMLTATSKNILKDVSEKPTTTALPTAAKAQGPGPDPFNGAGHVDKPVDKPVNKPGRTAKQLENDERLRARAAEKAAEKAAAKAVKAANDKVDKVNKAITPEPEEKQAQPVDPAEVVKIRQKTIEDLQSAYANGFQKEVFELLATHGNGAKSFRELPPEAFLPIRQAIDDGAFAS